MWYKPDMLPGKRPAAAYFPGKAAIKKTKLVILTALTCFYSLEGLAATKPAKIGLSVQEAALMALENNKALAVERINPEIRETFIIEEESVYDPRLTAESTLGSDNARRNLGNSAEFSDITTVNEGTTAAATKRFPGGSTVGLDFSTGRSSRTWEDRRTNQTITRLGVNFTQALLQGKDPEANLATLNQAKIDVQISEFELSGLAQSIVADTEKAYWDYSFAQRQLRIFDESVRVARQQLREIEERIKVGELPEVERLTVQAEIATLGQESVTARGNLEKARLNLLRLVNPSTESWSDYALNLEEDPLIPEVRLGEIKSHVSLAQRLRPEVNQTILQIRRNDLDIVRTKDGLLPRLDIFITMGKTGYADSFLASVGALGQSGGYDIGGGIRFDYPMGNRAAEARYGRANLTRAQSGEVLANLRQLVEMDVRSAYIDINQAREQIKATVLTTRLQQERLRAETERYKVGRSTAFIVAQAQREVTRSRIAGVQAVVNYLKSLTDFFRFEGSLLQRRGIKAPGQQIRP